MRLEMVRFAMLVIGRLVELTTCSLHAKDQQVFVSPHKLP